MQNNYDLFAGPELYVADEIQRLRLQLLVHSYLYYKTGKELWTNKQWDEAAKRLAELQKQYPSISEEVRYAEAFRDWDGTTGEMLPLDDPWVIQKANQLAGIQVKPEKKPTKRVGRLF